MRTGLGLFRRPVSAAQLTAAHALGKGIRVFGHLLHQLPTFGSVHLAHEIAHLPMLFEQLVDVPDLDACSPRDALAPQSVDDLRVPPLLHRH